MPTYQAEQDQNIYYIESSDLAWKSVAGNKNFLLTIDTHTAPLVVDAAAKTIDNCTSHPYNMVSYDGTIINSQYDPNIGAFIATE